MDVCVCMWLYKQQKQELILDKKQTVS